MKDQGDERQEEKRKEGGETEGVKGCFKEGKIRTKVEERRGHLA